MLNEFTESYQLPGVERQFEAPWQASALTLIFESPSVCARALKCISTQMCNRYGYCLYSKKEDKKRNSVRRIRNETGSEQI